MSRPLRILLPGGIYHVTSRGNRREPIFAGPRDRSLWLDVLTRTCRRANWRVHAWCQMDNHYHLVVETPDGNLSFGMRHLNGVFTQRINRARGQQGHVFQGRFHAVLIERETHLLEVLRYVVLNPVRARLVDLPEKWTWSSYRATVGFARSPSWLERRWTLSQFGEDSREAISRYVQFVAAGIGGANVLSQSVGGILAGTEAFSVAARRSGLDRVSAFDLTDVPLAQKLGAPRPLLFFEGECADRREAMARAYASGGYTQREIGRHFGVSRQAVARAVDRFDHSSE